MQLKGLRMCTRYTSLLLVFLSLWAPLLPIVNAGDAEVSRNKNLQQPELEAGNGDITRFRNLAMLELAPNNADITGYRNLGFLESQPNNADIIRYKNLPCLELGPNDADVIRYRNLLYLPMDLILSYAANITSLTVTDQNGNPTNTFLRGDMAQFKFTIKNIGNFPLSNALVSTQVQDPSSNPVFLSYSREDLAVQASKNFIIGYKMPDNGLIGSYTVKVMVFTDWPSSGGIGLDIETATFTVS